MEFVVGGLAAASATCITNPLDVVKTRMQLQGELQARGGYKVHYRNVFHAFYTIVRKDGILAIQKGLVPALWYQFAMNGVRLGTYSIIEKTGFTKDKDGKIITYRSIITAAFCGAVGATAGSPFYLVKTQLQSKANDKGIAVGHQHNVRNLSSAFVDIIRNYGVLGLWRGTSTQIARMVVSSSIQLGTFAKVLEYVRSLKLVKNERSWINSFVASSFSGIFVTLGMAPPDIIATRMYNQPVDANGKGLVYKSLLDCGLKIYKEEGFRGFFKGWTASYFRIGPHVVLLYVFWDQLKYVHQTYKEKNSQK